MKSTDNFIANAGKATQKKEVFYDVFNGQRVRQGDDLDITWLDAFCIVGVMFIFGVIVYLALGG